MKVANAVPFFTKSLGIGWVMTMLWLWSYD